ncbi:FecR domain-containing protein [Ramlibacter sp. USB13]|uniref:FecR domain-containing protein n=1 Tax=Ramlibacter cellulosilyticus TaxID=2764187 RepID=A0A923SA05_9BURK|nr:FecR family protein [Ramlibacter cellulosilyticus]MBC5781738.1 FecR domain-containing protein [Ramlibacter cellulosilyticus]
MSAAPRRFQWFVPLAAASLLLALAPAWAQTAGEVEFSRGVGFAQTPGEGPRTLGRGLPLREGDRLTTSEGASAIIKLQDGTRMTVRPNSELVLQQYQFRENAPDNSMLMQLVRGGFRAVTGLISKGSPNAARIQTSTATIGIRGTDFDARLCTTRECAQEASQIQETRRPNAVQASAKLTGVQGEIFATDGAGARRRLVNGGSVYPGDVVETARGAQGVLVFRDESRLTLGSQTRFRLDNFVYDEQNAGEGRFLASVLRGSVRALTGLIARANNRNVGFSTSTATIGIRGTGFDLTCTGACAGEAGEPNTGLTLWTWLGSIEVGQTGQTALQVLQAGQGLFIPASGPFIPIMTDPSNLLPRPDQVNVPPKLFAESDVSEEAQGLFVFVREGHIEIDTLNEQLHLGRGESGFAGMTGELLRPTSHPGFMDFDRIPLPTSRNPMLTSVLNESGVRSSQVCR